MSCVVMIQTQISAIMEVLVKAAVAEISQLLEDALHQQIHRRNDEIRRRNEEIRGLKARLILTETKLQRITADTCSVSVQVDMMDTSVAAEEPQGDYYVEEKTVMMTSPEKELRTQPDDEELSGLEFQMKIEQVEELVDQKLNVVQTEQNHHKPTPDDRNSHVWPSGGHPEKDFDHPQADPPFTDSYVAQDPMSSQSGLFGVMLENESFSAPAHKDMEYSLNHLTASHNNCTTDISGFPSAHVYVDDHPRRNSRPKPFRCEECGTGFTQKTRLITHRRVHTGEKPFRCQLCGKTFSRQDNCLRHVRLHNGQRW